MSCLKNACRTVGLIQTSRTVTGEQCAVSKTVTAISTLEDYLSRSFGSHIVAMFISINDMFLLEGLPKYLPNQFVYRLHDRFRKCLVKPISNYMLISTVCDGTLHTMQKKK